MRAGRLRHRVAIQQKSQAATLHLEMEDTWTTTATVWAQVNPKSSNEGLEADRTMARATHEITMRTRTIPTANMRLLFGSRVFYVDGPPRDHDERGIHMVLDCRETVE